jgi:hypothetical protein
MMDYGLWIIMERFNILQDRRQKKEQEEEEGEGEEEKLILIIYYCVLKFCIEKKRRSKK